MNEAQAPERPHSNSASLRDREFVLHQRQSPYEDMLPRVDAR